MASFPLAPICLTSLVAAYLLNCSSRSQPHQPAILLFHYLQTFVLAWFLQSLLWAVWVVLVYPKYISPLRHLPGPRDNHWLMGQWLRIRKEPTGVPMREWVNTIPNDGIIRYLGIFNQERLLIVSPKALSEVLVTRAYDHVKPSAVVWVLKRILGHGLLLAEGDEHRTQRRNLMPAFAFRHVKDLYGVFWDKSRECVQAMTAQIRHDAAADPGRGVLETYHWASRATLDIIGAAGLGRDFHAVRDPDNYLSKTYRNLLEPTRQSHIISFLGSFVPGWLVERLPVRRNDDIRRAKRVLENTCRDLIREKRERLARKELGDRDILSVALESGVFAEDNLIDQLLTFLAAGHETTASALVWAVYQLCLHPDVQARLRAEVRVGLPSVDVPDAHVTSAHVDRLPYLNAVCSEVLRYHAPVPMITRVTARDTWILGTPVPAGVKVIVSPAATNHDVAMWGPDAGRFDPDRWLVVNDGGSGVCSGKDGVVGSGGGSGSGEEDGSGLGGRKMAPSGGAASNYAFMTFIHGPRSCIGMGFARAELASLLAAWIGRFEFSLKNAAEYDEKNLAVKGGVTARPVKGLMVNVRVVEGW